jgi:phospholipid/cholesterol/gamma-HCH transport system substrate-binding protein
MAQRKQASLAEMRVGILVTISLVILAALILQQSWNIDWFSRSAKTLTYLPDVGGLKPGAPVWLAGMEIGKVRKVTIVPPEVYSGNSPIFIQIGNIKKQIEAIDPSLPSANQIRTTLQDQIRDLKLEIRMVEVQLDIRQQYLNRVSRDSEVAIESRGLIGDSFIQISPGTYGIPPIKRNDFYVIEGVRTSGFREIMTGANDVIANFGVLSEQVKNIALKINPEKVGSGLATTITELQNTLRQANQTFARATVLVEDMRAGNGTIGKLVSDPTLYNRLTESLDKFNQIANQIQNGSGTLSKLLKDPHLFDKANETLSHAEVIMNRIEKGEGTLGRLSKDPALFDTTKHAMDRFSSLVEQIEKGNGTMGKLLKDPSLYNNLDQSTAEITKFIYDLRQDPKKYLTIRFRLF